MAKKDDLATSPKSNREAKNQQQAAIGNLTFEELKKQANVLLFHENIPHNILSLSPEEKAELVDKVDEVCWDFSFFLFRGTITQFLLPRHIPL